MTTMTLSGKLFLSFACVSALAGGCASIKPGPLTAVQPTAETEQTHVGRAYLLRGFIGVFSTGMNRLGDELNAEGVQATVFQADQWDKIADTIADRYHDADDREPFVLVGHSYGADNIIKMARRLNDRGVKVDLLITLDPVTPDKVPGNVVKCVNLYQTNGAMDALPWLRGIPLEADKNATEVVLLNENIRDNRKDLLEPGLNHFNIEKKEKVHAEIIKQIKAVCPPRAVWTARREKLNSASAFNGDAVIYDSARETESGFNDSLVPPAAHAETN